MPARLRLFACSPLAALLLCALSRPAVAIDSAFAYQGHLSDAGAAAEGDYDLQFTLQDAGGAAVASALLRDDVAVAGGVFTVQLDFGAAAFNGDDRFLQIGVRRGDESGAFVPLAPRTALTPAPYAQTAATAEFAASVADNSVGAAQIADASIGAADIDSSAVQRRVSGSCPDGQAIQSVTASGTVSCEAGLQGLPGATGPQGEPGSADAWSRLGNAGTDPTTNFIGTTDAQAFEIRTQNSRHLRIEPSTMLFNGAPITANVIAGSAANGVEVGVRGATIAGGGVPAEESDPGVFAHGPNRVTDAYGTIGGGAGNTAGDATGTTVDRRYATVAGGRENLASGNGSSVGGGSANSATRTYATVGGGSRNNATGVNSTVAGGDANDATANYAAVSGGFANAAIADSSAVAGGRRNFAMGDSSTVAGGFDNCAGGSWSFAGGFRAKVRPGADPDDSISPDNSMACDALPNYSGDVDGDEGSFVWADSQNADFLSTGPDQFNVRASGGVTILANGTGNGVDIDAGAIGVQIAGTGGLNLESNADVSFENAAGGRQMLNLYDETYGIGVQTSVMYFRSATAFACFEDGSHNPTAYDPGGGTLQMRLDSGANLHVTGSVNGTVFNPTSDREAKMAFEPIDSVDILARVLELPISRWRFKRSPDQRHIGPMAQDFHAAFGLNGADDKHIATVDADGVALAAIQGLNAKLEAENAVLRQEIETLRRDFAAELAELRVRLSQTR